MTDKGVRRFAGLAKADQHRVGPDCCLELFDGGKVRGRGRERQQHKLELHGAKCDVLAVRVKAADTA